MTSRGLAADRTSLRRRLGIALVAGGLVLALLLAGAFAALLRHTDRQQAVTGVYFDAITQADRAYTRLVDAETSVRGYALTADPTTLELFERLVAPEPDEGVAAADPEETEAALRAELGEGHDVLVAREAAATAARTWYTDFAEPTIAAVEAGGRGAVTVDEVEAGRVFFDDVRVHAEEYIDLLTQSRQAAIEDLQASNRLVLAVLVSFAVAALAVGVLVWVFLRRWVTDPLATLAADARVVADGDVGHPVGLVGPGEVGALAHDIEQMRLRLADLVAEARASQAALEESHAQLVEQAEDLRRSNRDLEQFAYVASHDLQEPLRKVASFTQLLAKRYEGQLDERADQYIAFAVDGAKRMQRLINDLLGFSRVGRIGGELADVELDDVLGQVSADLDRVVEETGGAIEGSGLPVVRGERPLLVQLVANLVGNALKFRHPDRAPRVRFEARRSGDQWEVACHDNGIGIDPQYADRVFVIFQRLHAKDVYEGTGIGLALCKKIVEYHGGHIWIDPEPADGGTTIRFTLPVAEAGTDAPSTAARPGVRAADAPAVPVTVDAPAATGRVGSTPGDDARPARATPAHDPEDAPHG
ncbi:sensor histidine kinase [Actinotalea solisilvae]|uniref:sensor histidine kinase n=1 Tax=Actinotalea solisilvae TaxID=2072922 RepID=UPI0018F266C5|nr:sensor histidine kinase [Actinotalea solisilvae]